MLMDLKDLNFITKIYNNYQNEIQGVNNMLQEL